MAILRTFSSQYNCGKVQLVHGGAHQRPAGIVQLALQAHIRGLHVGVTSDLVGRAASSGG